MYFRGLDLNLLVVLDALIAEKNISRTGEKIHLSQSATSAALARLREYFKDDLLIPLGRKMALTPLAEELAQPVRELLQQAGAVILQKPMFTPESSERTFRIVMSDYVTAVLMTQVLPDLQRQAPGISVQILEPRIDALDRGEADLVIMPHVALSQDHPSEALFEDEFVCIACATNRAVTKSLSERDYLRFGHVVVRFGADQQIRSFEETFLERSNHTRRIEVVTTGFTLVPRFVVGTKRIATINRSLAELYATQLPIKLVRSPFKIPPLVEAMQWHTLRDSDLGLQWFRRLLKSAAEKAFVASTR